MLSEWHRVELFYFEQGLFLRLADDNMVGIFYDNNFLGVIFLGAG